MWTLDPISIATQGYVAPTSTGQYCPQPLPIASHGYITFAVAVDRRDGDGGHGAVILEPRPYEAPKKDLAKLALIAVIAIEENYD